MNLFLVIQFFSLMFALISIIRLFPFRRGNVRAIILKSFFSIINILSIIFFAGKIGTLSIIVVVLTILFTEGYQVFAPYISKNIVNLIKNNSFILQINRVLMPGYSSDILVKVAKAYIQFNNGNIAEGEIILANYLDKINYDQTSAANCISLLKAIDQTELAFKFLHSISVDLTKKGVTYAYLQIAIPLYCELKEYEIAEAFLDYIETYYYDAQHTIVNLHAFLYYFACKGDHDSFNNIVDKFPALKKSASLVGLRSRLNITLDRSNANRQPKDYQFNLSKNQKKKMIPFFIFGGVIAATTLMQLFFSEGSSLAERLLYGDLASIDYLRYGAAAKYLIKEGEWIRLITPVFLHAGLLHLAMNLYGFFVISKFLYRYFNFYIILLTFILGAVIGNLFSFFLSDSLLSVGASGGVFSLLGAMIVFILMHRKEINPTVFKRLLVNFGVIFAVQIYFSFQQGNIDNWAHFGGLITGAFLTFLIITIKERKYYRYIESISKLLLIGVFVVLVIYWPGLINKNYLENLPLSQEIVESGVEYFVPETWAFADDRYYDTLFNSQIIFDYERSEISITDDLNAAIDIYTVDGEYTFSSKVMLDNGWEQLILTPNDDIGYQLYYIAKADGFGIRKVYVFIPIEYSEEYSELIYKILNN